MVIYIFSNHVTRLVKKYPAGGVDNQRFTAYHIEPLKLYKSSDYLYV